MSRLEDKLYYFAKIMIEAETPLVLASGKSGNLFDVELVRDANGLPAIPGTTLTGIIRHAVSRKNKELAEKVFGSIKDNSDRNVSAFECSWGYVHNSLNSCTKDFIQKKEIENDSILEELCKKNNPQFMRNHTKLNDKGVVKDSGKFDCSFVPAGTRFTFTMGMWFSEQNETWNEILTVLHSPLFRIGGAGRAGYGKIKVIDIKVPENGFYDISKEEDLLSFKDESKLVVSNEKYKSDIKAEEICLNFPLGFRIGGGRTQFSKFDRDLDMKPYSEKVIEWHGNSGTFTELPKVTIPGSSVKGVLRHRAAYHLARIKGQWADVKENDNDGLSDLFGDAETENKDSKSKKISVGRSGKIFFTDLHLDDVKTYVQSRNSIDRFTGGTRKGALFQEENVSNKQTFKMCVYYDSDLDKDSNEFKAFEWALEDLKNGRLAIGGGAGHGLGFNQIQGE